MQGLAQAAHRTNVENDFRYTTRTYVRFVHCLFPNFFTKWSSTILRMWMYLSYN